MTSNFGDVTIVGDAGPLRLSGEFNGDLGKGPLAMPKPQRPRNDFTTTDYSLQERPFFVPIGTGGVLAALQKLDGHLLNVRFMPLIR
jgi:hypothetical protein